jgi:WD40 repeat protein
MKPDERTPHGHFRDRTGKEGATFTSEQVELLEYLVFTRGGRLIAAGTVEQENPSRQSWVWDVESGSEEELGQPGGGQRGKLGISPDGRSLLSSDWDGTLRLWDLPRLPRGKLSKPLP